MLVANQCHNKSVFLARLRLSFPPALRGPDSSPSMVGCGTGHLAHLAGPHCRECPWPFPWPGPAPVPPPWLCHPGAQAGGSTVRGWEGSHSPAWFVPGHRAGRLPCATIARVPVGTSTAPQRLMAGNTRCFSPALLLRVQVSLGWGCPQGDSLPLGACGTSRFPGGGASPGITASPSEDAVSIGTQEATRSQAPEAATGHGGG